MEMKAIFKRAGGIVKFAKCLGYKKHTHLYRWQRVPAEMVVQVEAATGVPREILRPDLYIRATSFPNLDDQREAGQ